VPYAELDGSIQLGYIFSEKSWNVNVKRMRKVLWQWAWDRQIRLGNLDGWKQAARKHRFTGTVKDVCLWMDSSDVHIENHPDRDPYRLVVRKRRMPCQPVYDIARWSWTHSEALGKLFAKVI